jgi:pimeloyl-ACP methyl ester carboxylesterase
MAAGRQPTRRDIQLEVATVPTATVNGVRLYYEVHGDSGEPLVLVHGYTGDITDWRHQLPEFSRTHRVLAMDHRGHGRSEAPKDRSSYTIEQMASDVEALIDQVGFDRYHLLGHSMGGAIVQEIALRSLQRLLSLTLEDTSFKFAMMADPEVEDWWKTRMALAEAGKMAELADLPPPVPPPPHMPAERLEETNVRLSNMSPDAFIGAWQGLVGWRGTKDRAAAISTPTLVIYGDLDTPALVEACKRLAELIPNARVEVIPETGHSPQQERPELFNRALRRHLEAHAGRG